MTSVIRRLARTMATAPIHCSPTRSAELAASLAEVREQITRVAASAGREPPVLVAVSKLKPAEDVAGCFEHGHLDFGENYAQELVDKAAKLPESIRWHFIGTLQSNKAKALASIPNLHAVHTLTSVKAATALNKGVPEARTDPLNVLLQVNTSGEDSKSGLDPPSDSMPEAGTELLDLAEFVVQQCPRLRLLGLMTIGSLETSLAAADGNRDFDTLVRTRDAVETFLRREGSSVVALEGEHPSPGTWGVSGRFVLSMGMSSDFEAAIAAGSGIIRVGTNIFGSRA